MANLTTRQEEAIERMTAHVVANCKEIDREQRFRDMLDEIYDLSSVGGPFAHMQASKVLEDMDPIAFRCGVNDYMDGEDTYEINSETYDRKEVDEAREEFLDDLRSELADAETEIEDDDEPDTTEVDELTADIEACERHTF